MGRFVRCLAVVALAVVLAPVCAHAQIDPRRCDLFDGPGCNPYECGILDGPGCQAQSRNGGIGETLLLTLSTRAAAEVVKPDGEVNAIRDLFATLRSCVTPPVAEVAQRGMEMSMRFSLSRDGTLIGEPKVTYASRDVSEKTRDLYRDAIAQSLHDCAPFRFTKGFGGAIAGRPIAIRVIEDREEAPAKEPM
jgi:hypothetical protein